MNGKELIKFLKDIDKTEVPYPENLICAITGEYCKNMADEDIIEGLHYLLNSLTEREQKILELRFAQDCNYDDIGKYFSVTRERIRQIEARALRKLRHPTRNKFVKDGYTAAKKELNKLAEARHLKKINEIENCQDAQSFRETFIKVMNTDIDALALSERSSCCLRRAAINTLGDLCHMKTIDLYNVRNLGAKSYNEIAQKLHVYGLKFQDEDIAVILASHIASMKVSDDDINVLELSERSSRCLRRANINTLAELCRMKKTDLCNIRNLGAKSYDEITIKLHACGLRFQDEDPDTMLTITEE